MIKRFNKLGLMMLAVGAMLFAFLAGGSNVLAASDSVDPTGQTATINIVDTMGNVLKGPLSITYEPNVKSVDVTVPGYDPAKTLEEVDYQFNPDYSPHAKSTKYTINKTTNKVDGVLTYFDKSTDTLSADKSSLDSVIGSTSTLNEAFAKYIDLNNMGIAFYSKTNEPFAAVAALGVPKTFTVVYDYQEATMPVEYVNDNNGAIVKTDTIKGFLGKKGTYTPVVPSGYQLVTSSPVSYDLISKTNAKMTIHIVPIPVTPVTPTPTPKPTPVTPTNPYWNPTTNKPADGKTGLPEYANVKKTAVYAVKSIYMYSSPAFNKNDRIAKYPKQKRINRPMFVITGYDRSNNGALRFKVRDINEGTKNYGKTGYITAKRAYVLNLYYRSMPKNNKITVIAKGGVNSYKTTSLTGKTAHYKKGTRLHVKKLVKHNLTTRYQLTNGRYVSANKTLVIQGNY
ncbi:hypothetical protein LASUN_16530 [Lentilactobacillus sunkii]|uniref:DUF5776 domain-containing protein n=1 Tax=Lentilactobacillus sunkii TaxID=481719 RepID=A0A1E7XBW7_9LACO|nr:DUF5776 domain-containing protein [Lentilactobacillus sunkii]OFA10616.1 hypothetical protein LASUN_16530 [Lentilactobacillus sunkii]